jgi:hypothetical protein
MAIMVLDYRDVLFCVLLMTKLERCFMEFSAPDGTLTFTSSIMVGWLDLIVE